jgi:glyoxylase-like metal-dependent hydrolase (beta-lactamase superfamily II)
MEPMEQIGEYLKANHIGSKPVVVFNSHGDFDHYWGNGSFKSSMILSHELCRLRIEREGEEALVSFQENKQGKVEILLPNTVFSERIFFADDGVEFYHTPGHTLDSASCFDHFDKVLFVGDNIESPLPHLNELNSKQYTTTLEEYLNRNAKAIVSGHDDLILNDTLIRKNMDYIKNFQTLNVNIASLDKEGKIIHYMNLTTIGEKLRSNGKQEEALNFYEESKAVLDQLDDSTQGKQEQLKNITEIIDSLSKQQTS